MGQVLTGPLMIYVMFFALILPGKACLFWGRGGSRQEHGSELLAATGVWPQVALWMGERLTELEMTQDMNNLQPPFPWI